MQKFSGNKSGLTSFKNNNFFDIGINCFICSPQFSHFNSNGPTKCGSNLKESVQLGICIFFLKKVYGSGAKRFYKQKKQT